VIVVDSSVLIAAMRGHTTEAARRFRSEVDPDEVMIGDLVLLEVLQGADGERHARAIERELRVFVVAEMLDLSIAVKVAENFRQLRRVGVTIRKTTDLVIGTFCIERGHLLLQQDRDFAPMVEHLGLRLV